mmetsp:Transcript_328/g.744  ORF Transcript_328/g.744 Transcript_328/m.744 type:complete len:956 (-) Transcript_328:3697-6564(-)|eukprot:CAMPEP_0116131664 /NCGR_PEP_ID=MMETSP0329-20121206/9129_1 /TAXON_ID=697910 /ORGANISM="Pseudo-nitzschia arenysensis, Strain B593" /LENGTH=955 /DNA_ID=CAMNT_0003626115 /DNA_START=32 /DNA_END=2899 /DNA_ORIENTATION=+
MTETTELVVSLTDSSVGKERVSPPRVGGKASSLATLYATDGLGSRVPKAHALTVDFFAPWVEEIKSTETLGSLSMKQEEQAKALCAKLQAACLNLSLSTEQSKVIQDLSNDMSGTLVAVRSSAPEEDGTGASFAGAFETKLAVETTFEALETAVKECFASLWDYRVLLYKEKQHNQAHDTNIGFAVVVMEMVDSVIAGVAFSANPLNSDRDELVIDSSWGLGESVVDGSVTADRYVVDKILRGRIIEESIGEKGNEKRLGAGGVVEKSIAKEDPRYSESTLSPQQIKQLCDLVCLIESTYKMPMDVEWAFVADDTSSTLSPRLLQARPITTLFSIDPEMMTEPGAKRRLYFDINVLSEATTTSPFSTMDMDLYCNTTSAAIFGMSFDEGRAKNVSIFDEEDPNAFVYNGMTRQYANFGFMLKYTGTDALAKQCEMMDPYLASIIRGSDCNRKKYKTNFWMPKGLNRSTVWEVLKFVSSASKTSTYAKDPEGAMKNYQAILKSNMEQFDRIVESDISDFGVGLSEFGTKLSISLKESIAEECAIIFVHLMPLFNKIDDLRQNGETEEIKEEYDALGGGYEGDELMEINISLYQLAQSMPKEIWKEYTGENGMSALIERIQDERDLPADFLNGWKSFMNNYGFDGQDQLFISCPRYSDSPELLIDKLRINATGYVKDPSVIAKEKLNDRRDVMAKQENVAKNELAERSTLWNKRRLQKKLKKVHRRNLVLDHMMMIRNAPKIHLTKLVGAMRTKALKIEEKMISEGRLEEKGDIFHLTMEEVDRALLSEGKGEDLRKIVGPRKTVYKRALASNECPLLVDSRCRILKADPPTTSNEPGTLVGASISPGVATGKVRIIRDLSAEQTRGFGVNADGEHEDHVLCAVVTGPAWTPLFASASAVVLQIGGLLQHGALCAREYGKPAVSNIDVYSQLKDGMTISVDGNTGIVKILDDGNDDE